MAAHSELRQFVREALARGLARDAIRARLLEAGWRPEEVDGALGAWAESDFPIPVPRRRPHLNARDTFLYLVLFATLYTSAFNVGQILFALIERWIPDPIHATYWDGIASWIRGATAGVIIAFPVFLGVSRAIGRDVAREPDKRHSPVRKWLTYLTLFLAALVIIGDLTVLVTRVLGGELAPRFLLKTLVVFLIAGIAFTHYLGDLRRDEADVAAPVTGPRPLARLAAAAVLAVMLAGLVFSGSPREARWRLLDEQRVQALSTISNAIQSYHGDHGTLPDSLGTLLQVPGTFGAELLLDPDTGEPYAYQVIDSLHFELCATFQTADPVRAPARGIGPGMGSEFWKHGAERKCFRQEATRRRTP